MINFQIHFVSLIQISPSQSFILLTSVRHSHVYYSINPLECKGNYSATSNNTGKPSAIGQPTRPIQPFILLGPINE